MTDEATEPEEGDVTPAEPQDEQQQPEPSALSPEAQAKELEKARKEAAKYRTERNDTREQLDAVQAQLSELAEKASKGEQVDDLQSQLSETVARLQRVEAAREAGLPKGFEDRLKGGSPEELLEDAKNLAGFLTPAAPARDDLDVGPRGGDVKPPTLDDQIKQAEADGNTSLSIRLKAQKAVELSRSSG